MNGVYRALLLGFIKVSHNCVLASIAISERVSSDYQSPSVYFVDTLWKAQKVGLF